PLHGPAAPDTIFFVRLRRTRPFPSGCAGHDLFRPAAPDTTTYRLLNWKRFRAPAIPYFLRSLARASRVSKPSLLRGLRNSALYSTSARAMPSRTAPACPDTPPPATVARMSNLSAVSVNTSGVRICMRSASVGKKASNALRLTLIAPAPGRRNTRAVDVFLRPVP